MAGRGNPRGRGRGGPGGPAGGGGGGGQGRGGIGGGVRGRGGPRGGAPSRGGSTVAASTISIASHVEAVGIKRPGFGLQGRPLEVHTNHFECSTPEGIIHHYDVISPSEKTLPARVNFEIIKIMQTAVAPNVFTPRGAYDGRKNLFSSTKYSFGNSAEFSVCLATQSSQAPPPREGSRGPKVYKVKLTHVAEINPEVLSRFLNGQQTHDNEVLTAITSLNVAVRMEPNLRYPFNVRSFFTPEGKRDIGGGIELWRGYFQSVRPSIGRMLINLDITTGAFFKSGPLLTVCLDFMNSGRDPNFFSPRRGFTDRMARELKRFLLGVRITTPHRPDAAPRGIRGVSTAGANDLRFTGADGRPITVARYFQTVLNRPLQFPDVVCVELGTSALMPLELCVVHAGQLMNMKKIPDAKTSEVVNFATQFPQQRLDSIRHGLSVLAYGQSDYVRQFGITVNTSNETIQGRVLNAPTLRYHASSRQPTIQPRDGAWNMIDKKVYKPGAEVARWVVVIFEQERRFGQQIAEEMISGFVSACRAVGLAIADRPVHIQYGNPQAVVSQSLKAAGQACAQKAKAHPQLMVIILPEAGNAEIYRAVKHFGDCVAGVTTQCMKSAKCSRAKAQYYANVILKLNVKLGGVNAIPDARSAVDLSDPNMPTLVMGADAIHPAPGSLDRPSFTAVVGNVDTEAAKYIATIEVQASREEMITSLQKMAKHVLEMYMTYRRMVEKKANPAPKRIIFYRDGVSEGQFRHVIERELPLLQAACAELKINPKITIIVVGKRHHVRFFPRNENEGDRKSKNCPAGLVIDRAIVNPVEFDFYLQSHGGILGTSRSAHYNVLYDENKFTADGIQSLSFALCHVYARATRSVSIPAPVYYADIVCSRAKHHYDPEGGLDLTGESDTATNTDQTAILERFRAAFKPLHASQGRVMYFC